VSIKRVVGTAFWDDEKVVNDFTPEDKYFFLYLLTNPRSSMLGVYKLVPKVAAFEMGYSVDAVLALIERFETKHNIIRFNRDTCEVAIKNYLKHSIVKGGKPIYDRLMSDLKQVTDKSLVEYIRNNLSGIEGLNQTVLQFLANTADGSTDAQYTNMGLIPPLPEVTNNVPNVIGNGRGRGNGVTPPLRGRNGDVTSDDVDLDLPFGITEDEIQANKEAMNRVEIASSELGLPWNSADEHRANGMVADYTAEWVLAAIDRTGYREKRTWGTVAGILRSWKKKGGIDDPEPKSSVEDTANDMEWAYNRRPK